MHVFESSLPQVNGVLTACIGDEISLTCSDSNVLTSAAQWSSSPPVYCTALLVIYNPSNNPTCPVFMF